MLPPGARPARAILESIVETAASNTSPPGGPSEDQLPFPVGRLARAFRGGRAMNDPPGNRFPRSSIRAAGPMLDVISLLGDPAGEILGTACCEPIRAANDLDIAPRPVSRTQTLSKMARNP